MPDSKPTILFVPGAWHRPTCYAPVLTALSTLGYPTATVALPSVGATPGLTSLAPDTTAIQDSLTSLASAGKSIVVVAHSYGSLPAGEAIKPFLASTLAAQGQSGGVVHMLYIAAFVLPAGGSLMAALGGNDLPWFRPSGDKMNVEPADPEEVFYNDCEPEVQREQVAQLQSFSYQMFFQQTTWAPWEEVAVSYLFCTQDKALPVEVQRGMVQGTGVKWGETVVEAGHSPFLSRVGETVEAIVKAAGGGE